MANAYDQLKEIEDALAQGSESEENETQKPEKVE
jgi:hypothetical protein